MGKKEYRLIWEIGKDRVRPIIQPADEGTGNLQAIDSDYDLYGEDYQHACEIQLEMKAQHEAARRRDRKMWVVFGLVILGLVLVEVLFGDIFRGTWFWIGLAIWMIYGAVRYDWKDESKNPWYIAIGYGLFGNAVIGIGVLLFVLLVGWLLGSLDWIVKWLG